MNMKIKIFKRLFLSDFCFYRFNSETRLTFVETLWSLSALETCLQQLLTRFKPEVINHRLWIHHFYPIIPILVNLEPVVIQKFIKSNGPKAFICRTVWRKEKNPFSWVITNKADFYSEDRLPEQQKYITNPNIMNTCTIVNTCRGKYVEETTPYIKNILKYLH